MKETHKENWKQTRRLFAVREKGHKMADKLPNPQSGLQPPSLTIDWECYAEHLEDSDLSDDQKRDLIETLWSIVCACVDLGFGIHPVQQACEQNDGNALQLDADLLSSLQGIPHNQTQKPAENAAHSRAAKEES